MDLLKQIEAFRPYTEQETQTKKELLQMIKQYDTEILNRTCQAGHITCSGLILSLDLQKTLMAYHLIYQSVGWLGGHADGESHLAGVAMKEIKEETSIEKVWLLSGQILSIDKLPVPAHTRHGEPVPAHMHYNVTYGFLAPENQPVSDKPDENKNVQWLKISEIETLCTEPHMIPIYQKLISRMQAVMEQKKKLLSQICQPLLDWYPANHRDLPWRKNNNPYSVWVSEIMLQQTRAEAVKQYYHRFLKALPTVQALADCPEETLMKLWEGLGYYNRVRNMQKTARTIMNQYQGEFPKTYAEIRELSGIGDYTAGAIGSVCYDLPTPAVDGNVLRFLARLQEDFRNVLDNTVKADNIQQLSAIYTPENAGTLTQALIEIGATVCVPNGVPKCEICPVRSFCMAYQNHSVSALPVREKKQKRRTEYRTVFVLQCEDRIAVRKRPAKGLLASLWELPNMEKLLTPEECVQVCSAWGVQPRELLKINQRKHVFTHITWEMQGVFLQCGRQNPEFVWANPKELESFYSLPTAFRCILTE